PLRALDFTMSVANAQMKSAILLTELQATGTTKVHEPICSHNHTEIAVAEFGAHIKTEANSIEVEDGYPIHGKEFTVPGDLSSAAFFIAATLVVPNSKLRLTGIGLNPTRAGFISLLEQVQTRVTISHIPGANGEPVGDITAETSELEKMDMDKSW